jgi:hypothetical protein
LVADACASVRGTYALAIARFADDGDAARARAGESADPPIVDCDSRIQVTPSRRRPGRIPRSLRKSSVFAGPVVFVSAKQFEGEAIDPGDKRLRPVKVPMLVAAGHTVTVAVSPPTGRRAVVEVGLDRRPYDVRVPSVELRPCSRRAKVAGRHVAPAHALPGWIPARRTDVPGPDGRGRRYLRADHAARRVREGCVRRGVDSVGYGVLGSGR